MNAEELIHGIKNKKLKSLAKAITLVENQESSVNKIIKQIYEITGKAHYVGITGSPGVGKSTLINNLVRLYLEQNKKVAVIAVDPSSPITGGAILGDRIRIDSDLMGTRDFLFRSISNRSNLGGLSSTTYESTLLLDAYGFDVIIIETVGTGQSETSVGYVAHTNLVITAPGLGDAVQAEKAGILEIGDVFVVNKSDRTGASDLRGQLKSMINLKMYSGWKPEVILTDSIAHQGVGELLTVIEEHKNHVRKHPNLNRKKEIMKQRIEDQVSQHVKISLDKFYEVYPVRTELLDEENSHLDIESAYIKSFMYFLTQEKNK